MKFLCDQCKAKYQIADDKVQGKTLRMKCRKCGHVIEIRAAAEAPGSGETMQLTALSEEAAKAAIAAPPSIPAPAPAAPRPATGLGAPRPAAGLGGAPRPAAAGAPRPAAKPAAAQHDKAPASGALASAFNKQVGSNVSITEAPVSQAAPGHDVPSEEWYAAIDDVPVGPVRLSELRAKYAQGALTDDSLVWREGYEEWRPLRTLTELHAVVREEVSGAHNAPRGSLLPNAPSAARPAPRPATTSTSTRPSAPASNVRASSAGNVIPFVQARGGAAARRIEEDQSEDEETRMAAPAVLLPKPPEPAPRAADDPFGFGALPSAPVVTTVAQPALSAAPAAVTAPVAAEAAHAQHKGLSTGVVALIAAACVLFGVVVAVFAVKPKVVEKVIEKRVDVPVAAAPAATEAVAAAPVATQVAPEAAATVAPKVASKSGAAGAAAATTAAPTTTVTNKKLGGLDGPEGPAVGPGAGGGGGGGGGALEGKSVETVVASKRVGVRKVCFEPWADKGGASVKITLKIGPDGKVQSSDIATTSGEPAIGQCVQRLSRGWTFPASESGGTFNVPFLFGT